METDTKLQKTVAGIAIVAATLGQAGLVAIPIIGPILTITNVLSAILPSIFKRKAKITVSTSDGGTIE